VHGVGTYAREDYAFREVYIMNDHLIDGNFQHYYPENILQIGPPMNSITTNYAQIEYALCSKRASPYI